MFANMASQPVEVTEAEQPLQILSYEFVADRAGAGKYRGGTPYRRDYRLLEKEAILQVRADRHRFRPYGLYGGKPGKPSMNYLNPETENQVLPSKLTMSIKQGDVFRHEVAGAGGWGDPLQREPQKVLKDVRNEMISATLAEQEYGVIVNMNTWSIDETATAALRKQLLAKRSDQEPSKVSWHDE